MAAAAWSSAVFKRAASTAAQIIRHQHFSSAAAAAEIHRPGDFYCDGSEGEESAVYQHTLKFQRPSTIKQLQLLHNSVSLIGKIDYPFKRVNTKNGSFGVHTLLSVSGSSQSRPSFKWDSNFTTIYKLITITISRVIVWEILTNFNTLQSYVEDVGWNGGSVNGAFEIKWPGICLGSFGIIHQDWWEW